MKIPVSPMLAQAAAVPDGDTFPSRFDDDRILFEVKWDGYRAIAIGHEKDRMRSVWSRPGRNVTGQFPVVANTLPKYDCILDGEIISVRGNGHSFQALQNRLSTGAENLRYMAFDILELRGKDLTALPLEERRHIMYDVVDDAGIPIIPSLPSANGRAAWETVLDHQLEGVISKPASSRYVQGNRGIWQKHKRNVRQVFEVIGLTSGDGHRKGAFGALILGERISGQVRYAGKCGTGFDRQTINRVLETIVTSPKALVDVSQQTIIRQHLGGRTVVWVKPGTKVLVEFNDWSDGRIVRMGAFKGLVP